MNEGKPDELGVKPPAQPAAEEKTTGIGSDKFLIISVVLIVLLLISIFAFSAFNNTRQKTLEELHALNFQGKLKPSEGYVYKGVYSFINISNQWYTLLNSPQGKKVYSMAFRYSPKEVENIPIEGMLDTKLFDNKGEFYVTFNPKGKELAYVVLAVADFDTHMAKVFEKMPIPACDRNETEACKTRPIISCKDTDKIVLYVQESEKVRAYYKGNCIVVEGKGLDLVKGVDRILFNLYNIMDK